MISFATNHGQARRRWRARPWLLTLAPPLLLLAHAQARAQVAVTAGGRTVEVSLTPERPRVMDGEPVFLTFEVRNPSGVDLQIVVGGDYRNRVGRHDSYVLKATSAEGHPVREVDAGPTLGGMVWNEKIPAGGAYRTRLFLQHWVVPERPGTYTVSCAKALNVTEYTGGLPTGIDAPWAGAPVEVKTTLKVVPADDRAMGEVIARLGETLAEAVAADGDYLANSRRASDALTALGHFQDARAIPHLVAVMRRDDPRFGGMKYGAARALAKYTDDAALDALAAGMYDEDRPTRSAVAGALAESRHPRARALLLSMRRDEYVMVRLTVVHALGKVRTEESTAALREMAADGDEAVRREALRYLGERGAEVR